jgi:hypothetical protein
MMPARWTADIDDPWKGQARGFVVFTGEIPGVYKSWYSPHSHCGCASLTSSHQGRMQVEFSQVHRPRLSWLRQEE